MGISGSPATTTGLGPRDDYVEERKTSGGPVKAKRGPEAPTNVLHDYSNVTYKISFMRWKSIKDYNRQVLSGNWQSLKKMDDKEILFASGGVNNDQRNQFFDQDFHITSLSMDAVMYPTRDSRSTNITKGILTVTEPNGITMFERLQEVFNTSGTWHEHPFLIRIEFIGYDDNGNPKLIDKATRFIPVKISNMETEYQGGVTTYTIHLYLYADYNNGDPRNSYVKAETYKGKTVKEVLDSIAKSYNEEQKKQKTNSGPDDGLRSITNTVGNEIIFHIDERIGNSSLNMNIASKTTLTSKVGRAKGNPNTSARFSKKKRTETVDVHTYNSNVRVDLDKGMVRIEQAAGLVDIIEKILLYSDYTISQLNDPENIDPTKIGQQALKNPENGWDYWSISFIKELLDWDDIRNTYGVKLHVIITPFKIVQPHLTGTTKTPGDGFPDVVRNYNYLFTGQNTDIISFDTKLNREFIMSVIPNTLVATGDQTVKDPPVTKASGQGDKASAIAGSQKNPSANNTTGLNLSDNSKQTQANTLLENLYQRTGGGLVSGDLQIVGDPAYIYQDGVAVFGDNQNNDENTRIDSKNGAIQPRKGETHIYITYLTPDDYDEATGQVNYGVVNKKFRYSVLKGFYAVVRVTNTFNKGIFEQTLTVYRLYDQKPENKFTGKQKPDPEAGTVFTDVNLEAFIDDTELGDIDIITGELGSIPSKQDLEGAQVDNGIVDSEPEAEIDDTTSAVDDFEGDDGFIPTNGDTNDEIITATQPLEEFRSITSADREFEANIENLTISDIDKADILFWQAESRNIQTTIEQGSPNSPNTRALREQGQRYEAKIKEVLGNQGIKYEDWDDLNKYPQYK